jgi:hypothetical protein
MLVRVTELAFANAPNFDATPFDLFRQGLGVLFDPSGIPIEALADGGREILEVLHRLAHCRAMSSWARVALVSSLKFASLATHPARSDPISSTTQ